MLIIRQAYLSTNTVTIQLKNEDILWGNSGLSSLCLHTGPFLEVGFT